MSSQPVRNIKKACPACKKEFVGTLVVCMHDGTLLIPVKESLVGQVLAQKYRVVEEIGRGGMSIVYKGHHTVLDRKVAIKMLQAGLAQDETSKKRFEQEARAVAFLQHPNIITLYDTDVYDNQPYLVMDYLVGDSLTDIIKRDNHVGVARALHIFIQACSALEHAHQKGVIHRDLKSSNIMLVETEGKKDVVKVVDFGIAKLMPSSGKAAQNLTQTGEIFGSPIYMSPEQCRGDILDARSDIYSTGVMMYEALTGQPPLMGETIIDTMNAHVKVMPPPFARVRPDLHIPEALERVVFRCLEKNPEDRFQSMQDLEENLEYVQKKIAGDDVEVSLTPRQPRSTRQNMSAGVAPGTSLPKPMMDGPKVQTREAVAAPERAGSAVRRPVSSGSNITSFNPSDLRKMHEQQGGDKSEKNNMRGIVIALAIAVFILFLIVIALAAKIMGWWP